MKLIIPIILILFSYHTATSQIITRRALENSVAAPPGGNPTPPAISYIFATSDGITINWTASTDPDGIRLYNIYLNGIFSTTVPTTTPLAYTIFGLNQNTSYVITMRATDNNGNNSNPSNTLTRSTLRLHGPQSFNGNQSIINEFLGTTVDGYDFRGPGNSTNIFLQNCSNITFRNCVFFNTSSNCLELFNCTNINVNNNFFGNGSSGVYAVECDGGIDVQNNQFLNIHGPFPRGQYVQFNDCHGAGNVVSNNRGIAYFAESYPEDLMNFYASGGTSGSRLLIEDNIFVGGGPSATSGGIVFGDNTGQWALMDGNKLVNPGQYGLAVAGGNQVIITNNEVFSTQFVWTNIGYYLLDFGGGCSNITFNNTNKSNFICGYLGSPPRCTVGNTNNYFADGSCSPCACTSPTTGQSLASMNIPNPLLTFLDENYIWTFRSTVTYQAGIVSEGLRGSGGGGPPVQIDLNRPNCSAGNTQTITGSTATLTGTATAISSTFGTNTIQSVNWRQAKGSTRAVIANPTSLTTGISGLASGQYIFTLVVTQNNTQFGYDTHKSAMVTINVN